MLPLILEEVLINVKEVCKQPPIKFTRGTVTDEELQKMEDAVKSGSEFDRLGLKAEVWKRYQKGTNSIVCLDSPIARVIAILPKGLEIPDDWGRVFQLFGMPKHGAKWIVYWFGSITPRRFPKSGLPLAAEHLNGGYTQPCSTNGIFIYRIEEATRVLIHELLHASCQDPMEKSIPQREAHIETWAEIIFVAFRAKGLEREALRLWKCQTQWVSDTNHHATIHNNIKGEGDYGWRYLNGRSDVYKSLGLELPTPSGEKQTRSRFTHPELGD
jgi:hypothetical protein